MSRLGRALHAQPPGSCIDAIGSALARYQTLLDQKTQLQEKEPKDALDFHRMVAIDSALAQAARKLNKLGENP